MSSFLKKRIHWYEGVVKRERRASWRRAPEGVEAKWGTNLETLTAELALGYKMRASLDVVVEDADFSTSRGAEVGVSAPFALGADSHKHLGPPLSILDT